MTANPADFESTNKSLLLLPSSNGVTFSKALLNYPYKVKTT